MTTTIKKILLIFLLLPFACNLLFGKTIEVRQNSLSPEQAVKMAQRGDTVKVYAGKYKVKAMEIKYPMTLVGVGYPELDAGFGDEIFAVMSDSVTISGFSLKNCKYNFVKDNAAIIVDRRRNITIDNNIVDNTFFAIYLRNSAKCRITNNKVQGYGQKEALSGNAVHLWYCREITIIGNELRGHRDGIYLEFSSNCYIANNISERNIRYGLHFMFSDSCGYYGNKFSSNGAGAAVMYSKKIDMSGNTFANNSGTACYGLLLKEISEGRITHNVFYRNTAGIFAESTKEMIIEYNEFKYNAWALKILTNSYNNTFTNNNFITNSFEFSTNRGNFNNKISGNYWSEYRGYDLNGDGKGDIPHRPMTLFAYLSENYPNSLILNRSLFVNLLIIAESLLPSIIPKDIFDSSPRMEPVKFS